MGEKLSSESVTPPALAATAPPTPAWGQLPLDLTDPCSLRWVASAQMEAPGWAALLQGWALFLTSQTIGQTQKQTNSVLMMTIGKQGLYLGN